MYKRIIVLLLSVTVAAAAAAAAPAGAGAKAAPGAFAVYGNPAYGMTAEYPAGWKADEGAAGAVVVFYSPLEGSDDKFSENVNILVEDVSAHPGMTIRKYTETGIAQLASFFTDFRLVDNRRHTVDGRRARLIEYTCRQGEFQLHVLQAMTIADGKAYVLTFTAEEANYERYLPAARRIMESFKVR
jgi:hypothetical protein